MIHDLLRAIGFSEFTIRVEQPHGAQRPAGATRLGRPVDRAVLRALDKLGKIGPDGVAEEMVAPSGRHAAQAAEVLRLGRLAGTDEQMLRELSESLVAGSDTGSAGVATSAEVSWPARAAGVPPHDCGWTSRSPAGWTTTPARSSRRSWTPCPASAASVPAAGTTIWPSCSPRRSCPGIGASLGLDRLLAAMEELGMIEKVATPAPVFIPYFAPEPLHDYLRLAAPLRAAGLRVEVYPEPKSLGQQLKYADRRGFRVALIAGDQEMARETCQVKDLRTGQSREVSWSGQAREVVETVSALLAAE